MITLQIDDNESALLKELVNKYLVDLRREISRTEKKTFRAGLEAEEALMKKLLQQLPE
jgi:hypothetical protein